MLELVLVGIFLSVTLIVLSIGWALGSRRQQALRRAFKVSQERGAKGASEEKMSVVRMVRSVFRPLAFLFPDSSHLRLRLVQAGYHTRTAPLTYSSLRVMILATVPVLTFVVSFAVSGSFTMALLWTAFTIIASLAAPPYYVRRRIQGRVFRIRKHLPDALDLMVVCVEAGLGLDAAILKVSEELESSHPDIAHEFRVVTQLVNAGMPRSEALREMADRTGVNEVSSLVGTLIQAERLGTSIARTLRLYAEQLRTKRRQRAEEAASKAPIKMLIPMVLFVLPALFIVVVGPAIIVLQRTFSNMVQ